MTVSWKAFIVYGLIDPSTLLVRYIGKSSTGLARPRQHRSVASLAANTHKNRWIRKLMNSGLDYEIAILEHCADLDTLNTVEQWWISYGRALGWPLTNATNGGLGMVNPSPELRARLSAIRTGRYPTNATRQKMSAWQIGRKHSQDAIERMRLAALEPSALERARTLGQQNKGMKHSDLTRNKMSQAQTGRVHSEETKQKIGAAHRGRKHTDETKRKLSAARKRSECGSASAYAYALLQRRRGLPNCGPCEACRAAHRAYQRARYAASKADT